MGFSLNWIALKGATRESALSSLHLRGTGVFEEIAESPLTGAVLPTGWYIVIANRGDYPTFMEDKVLASVSQGTEVVTCFVEEHVMCSHAEQWKDGRRLWSLMHTADSGNIEHLEEKGTLPDCFPAIRNRLQAEQEAAGGRKAGVDFIFDIPIEVAERLTGYRHDRDIPGLSEEPYEVLATTEATPKRSWLRKILGV